MPTPEERIQTAINTFDLLLTLEPSLQPVTKRMVRNSRGDLLCALDDIKRIPATVCVDNHTVQRMIDAAGIDYRRSVFM